jgi:hypothetical protein
MIEIIGAGLTQWDTGRSVNVIGIDASHVHFANPGDSQAPIIDLAESMAKIPDYLLQTGKQLCVYAVNNGVTVESKIFPVRKRERPENYVYEDDQRNYIYRLIQSAEKAIDDANNAAKRAEEAAESVNGIDAVLFVEQDLTEAQKAQARKNIGVSSSGGGGESAVLYTPQELTEEQQAQARDNIYVPSTADFDDLSLTVSQYRNDLEEADYQLGLRVSALENGGGSADGGYKLIETITIEEETQVVSVDFDKKYKSIRVRVVFPSATTVIGYMYSKVKPVGYNQYTNMCGINFIVGVLYAEHIRIASEVSPFALFSSSTGQGNERAETMGMSFPIPTQYGFTEKDGFTGIQLSTYLINFPVGTVIYIMGV